MDYLTMHNENNGVNPPWQRFLFWDGTFYSTTNSFEGDGTCKCFIRQVCDDKNDKLAPCYADKTDSGQWLIDSGEFSVLPQRLPIKEIRTGDLGMEGIKYTVGKLNCTFSINDRINILYIKMMNEQICTNNINILIDGHLKTCMTFRGKSPIYELHSTSNYTNVNFVLEDSPNENCTSKILPFVSELSNYKTCENTINCQYKCSLSSALHFQVVLDDKEELSICELTLSRPFL